VAHEQILEMLGEYHAMLAEHGYDWGKEIEGGIVPLLQFADRCDEKRWMAAFGQWKAHGVLTDPIGTLVDALARPLPAGVAVVRPDGIEIRPVLPYALAGRPYRYDVIAAPAAGTAGAIRQVMVTADRPHLLTAGHRVQAVAPAPAARLRVAAGQVCRWSIVDSRGGAWFPDGAQERYDAAGRPFFYGDDVLVDVPAGELSVRVARGVEYEPVTTSIRVAAGETGLARIAPRRLFDPASRGWYGADLHVHMNYTGDVVLAPEDVPAMQRGEGLHLLNLVAANYSTGLVYDRPVFDAYAGKDLPGSTPEAICRFGIEYRNDLFGHFHVLGATRRPSRFNTGHPRSDQPFDTPPNSAAAAELRQAGATVGYTHPVAVPLGPQGAIDAVFDPGRARSYEARELVADAALGLVDCVDLLTGDIEGTEFLYHRLLGCGLRLAATAGTDIMLSRSRGRLTSNPVGWCRAYANLGTAPLSVPAWQAAVRAGRTFATNGPWLEIDIGGQGAGETINLARPGSVRATARAIGTGLETLAIVGPDGPVETAAVRSEGGHVCRAARARDAAHVELAAEMVIERPTWLAAVARGGLHPLSRGGRPIIYAHTSPVWVNLDGQGVRRAVDARWCLSWLDRFLAFVRDQGRFADPGGLAEVAALTERAAGFYQGIADDSGSAPDDTPGR
jgi:hypothetical protein